MINEEIQKGIDKANKAVVNDVSKTVDDLQALLVGPKRKPADLEKDRKEFVRGKDFSTPGGGTRSVPTKATDAKKAGPASLSKVVIPEPIEFIHFGVVHHDAMSAFDSKSLPDDTEPAEDGAVGQSVRFRAAVEREAILLGAITKSVAAALAEKEEKEGKLGDLMKLAADLVGGAPGTAGSAASADMKAFNEKISKAWDAVNQPTIAYADLHDAGIKLHEVRASLAGYLLDQIGAPGRTPPPAAKGLLSHLPVLGDIPLPGKLGEVVGMFRKVGGKLHDVQDKMIFGLTLAMQPAIERACQEATLDTIVERRPLVYPIWYAPMEAKKDPTDPLEHTKTPFAEMKDDNDPVGGDLKRIKQLDKINEGYHDAYKKADSALDDATEKPREIIEFLSKDVKPAPGHKYLDAAFQASTGPTNALGGSEKLGEIAVACFYAAISDDIPGFMTGFVETFVEYVFAVCVEFLRSVYRVLCSMRPTELVDQQELIAAGSTHILAHLVDFATSKLGLDDLLKDPSLSIGIPKAPGYLPNGIHWPDTSKPLTAAPIAAQLKLLLIDKASPYLAPVVDKAMSGLALRLNVQRAWATGPSATMEAHLGQLPAELALLFRGLFKPLWDFITDTVMHLVAEYVGKALGPAAKAVGVGGDALGIASSFIADAEQKASEIQKFAKNVEDRAKDFMKSFEHVDFDPRKGDLDRIGTAFDNLKNAATGNPFKDKKEKGKGGDDDDDLPGSWSPKNRKVSGKGVKIEDTERATVDPRNKWKDARDPDAKPAEPKGDAK